MSSLIKNVSLGLASVPIIATSSNLQEFEKGRIHHVDALISRLNLVFFAKKFIDTTFYANKQPSLSGKLTIAALSIPCALTFLKSSYASAYINPTMLSMVVRIEKHIGLLCYVASVANAVALIGFGHLVIGYTALTIFGLDLVTSSSFIQTRIPQVHKTRMVFIKYIDPLAELAFGMATRSLLVLSFTLLGLYTLLSEEHQKMRTKNPPSITTLDEFNTLWNNLHASDIYFEMNKERVPHIQIPTLDPSEYSQNKILEIFDAIDWDNKDFQKFLWQRVTGIAEDDPQKVFKDLENASLQEKKTHYKKELIRARKMSRDWLQAVLEGTARQDLLLFKQHICKMLLEHRDLLEKDKTAQSNPLLKGLLTLIFGSGGECHVAQEMKVKEAFLEIYKTCNKEAADSTFLLMLELAYKNTTEQAFRDILNPVIQDTLQPLIDESEAAFPFVKNNLEEEWSLRSLFRIHQLAFFALTYLTTKNQVVTLKKFQKSLDLTSVHGFTQTAKLFGKHFNIVADIDEVAERKSSSLAMNPALSKVVNLIETSIPLTTGKFYWNTQLEKIIDPWLATHFQEQIYFQLNDLTQWFYHLLEGLRTDSNTDAIDHMQEELQQVIPMIDGYPLAEYKMNGKKKVLVPTTQSLLAFAYGINLLKTTEPQSQSIFNYIDKNMHVYQNNTLSSINRQQSKSSIIQKIIAKSSILKNKMEIAQRGLEIAQTEFQNMQNSLISRINKETLFFV